MSKLNFSNLLDKTATERRVFYKQYGKTMKLCRTEMELTLSELSEQLDIPESDLSDYECGKPVPLVEGILIYEILGMRQKVFKK